MVRLNPLSRYDVESCYRAIRRLAKGKICSKSDADGDEEDSSEAAWGSNEVRGKKRFAGDVETLDAVKQNVGEALALVELSLVATSVYSEQSTSRRKTLRHHGHFKFTKDAARIERDSREDGADCFSSRRSRCRVFERVERARSFQVVRRSTYHDDADAVARDGSKGGQGQGQGQGRNLRRSSSDRPRPRSSGLVRPAENHRLDVNIDERSKERKLDSEEEPLEMAIVTDPDTGIKYRRGTLLGKGGFARCFEFSDVKTKETFAVKVVSGARMADQRIREKIIREVEIHRHLEHPNVVTFYGFFESKGSAYLILENCTQRSMVHVMTKRKTLTEPEVRYYMLQLVSGCRYIHGRRIIHRDLKLGNMLLDDRMRIKIADFGLATKVLFDGEKKTSVCGTPNYIAPEVLQKKGYSYEADIWALGCVMYTMLCGQPPFETKSLKETYHRIIDGRFTTPGHVTPAAAQLMSRMLTVEPTARARLAKISADRFFVCGYNPATLPTFCCHSAPRFPPSSAAERSRTWSVPRDFTVSKNFLPFFGRSLSDNTDKRLKKDGQNNIHPTRSKQTKAQEQCLSKTRQTQYQLSKSSINKTTTITNDKTKEIEKDPSGILADSQSNRNSFEKNLKLIDIKNSIRQTSLNKLDEIDTSSLSQQTNVGEMHEVSFEPLFQMMREAVKQSETKESKEPSSSSSSASSSSSSSTSSLDISSFGHCPLWITKWIDYSRKYGFGYQLSDGRYGILFSESGHILLSRNKKSVSYSSRVTSSESKSYSVDNIPTKLQQKVQVVRNLADCMTKPSVDGGGAGGDPVGARRSEAAGKGGEPVVSEPAEGILLQKWRKDSNVILLQLNNGTLQVNCLKDRSKTVISRSPLKSGDYFLTRVCRGRPAVTWPLESSVKADPKVVDVLRLALKLVDETIEDDNRAARSFARWRH